MRIVEWEAGFVGRWGSEEARLRGGLVGSLSFQVEQNLLGESGYLLLTVLG